jgi:aspartate/methionine/tyrosine aminotransferase
MRLPPFRIEHYYAKYEFTAEYMLSSSDAQSRSIGELLALEPGARERFDAHWLGYTESPGSAEFRAAVAGIYDAITPEDVLGVSSAEEGIFLLYNALLEPGDHTIVETPCYESALELARGTGAAVSRWERHFEDGWTHDLAALERLIQPNTRVLYINTPHNPTGLNIARETFDAVLDLARSRGITVFCDEVYRELEHDPAARLPAACDRVEHAVSLGSMSKAYGLAGLRLGWLATRDHTILERVLALKYYTTICSSAPSEFLTALALRHRGAIVGRNLEIVQRNLPLLEAFMARHGDLFHWVKPNATTMGFPRLNVPDVTAFCEDVVRETSVLLLPGAVYDQPQHVRVGFGRSNLPEALERLEAHLLGAHRLETAAERR